MTQIDRNPFHEDGTPFKFARELLVTDTVAYDVVASTEKTVSLRRRSRGDVVEFVGDPGGYGLRNTVFATASEPDADVVVRRVRKDGTVRTGRGARPLYFTDEEPRVNVDYRY